MHTDVILFIADVLMLNDDYCFTELKLFFKKINNCRFIIFWNKHLIRLFVFVWCTGKVGAVFHAPCANHCENIMKLMEDENRIRRQGLLLQKQYVDAAKNLSRNQKEVNYYSFWAVLWLKQTFACSVDLYL